MRVTATEEAERSGANNLHQPLGVPIEVDGWRLSNRQNTSGGGFFRAIFFSTVNFQPKKKKKNSAKKDTVATTNAGSDRVKTGSADNKKRAAIFLGCSFFWWQVVCGTEAFSADWSSPAEQRKRPKGDRFIALLFGFGFSFLNLNSFDWMILIHSVL